MCFTHLGLAVGVWERHRKILRSQTSSENQNDEEQLKGIFWRALRSLKTQRVVSRARHILFSLRASLKKLDWGWASSGLDIFDPGGVDSCSCTEQHSWHISFWRLPPALVTFAVDLLKCCSLVICHLIGCLDSPLLRTTTGGSSGAGTTIVWWLLFSEQQRTAAFCE